MLTRIMISAVLVAGVASDSLAAAPFDGSHPILCATVEAYQCFPGSGCDRVVNAGADIPSFFRIDITRMQATGSYQEQPTGVSTIERVEHVDGKLMLGGAEDGVPGVRDGISWSMSIGEVSGEFSLTGAGGGEAYTMFGNCTLVK